MNKFKEKINIFIYGVGLLTIWIFGDNLLVKYFGLSSTDIFLFFIVIFLFFYFVFDFFNTKRGE